jgi:carbonic anhydrase
MIVDLLARNKVWAERRREADPRFFPRLAEQQAPRCLWIGCSDARVSANEILDLDPGEVFVHRNIANLAVHTDLNYLSVLEFAVNVLKVEDVIVCGHYGCGGVRAALGSEQLGLIDNWLRHIRDIHDRHHATISRGQDPEERADLLVELNVLTQVDNVAGTPIVQNAWARGQPLTVSGLVYRLRDGVLQDLGYRISRAEEIDALHRMVAPRA